MDVANMFEGDLTAKERELISHQNKLRQVRTAEYATFAAAVIARCMILKALLIDIDLGPYGYGGLETVFGP